MPVAARLIEGLHPIFQVLLFVALGASAITQNRPIVIT